MNKERILALADLVERQPHAIEDQPESGFAMCSLIHECGTPSCIAGWAAWESLGRPGIIEDIEDVIDLASQYLDLGFDKYRHLFYPSNYSGNKYTPAHAAFTLRLLAETGEVDWSTFDAGHPVGANLHE
jgi:hypothetical protein